MIIKAKFDIKERVFLIYSDIVRKGTISNIRTTAVEPSIKYSIILDETLNVIEKEEEDVFRTKAELIKSIKDGEPN